MRVFLLITILIFSFSTLLAQHPSIYDEKGKVKSVELRKYEESLNKQRQAAYKSPTAPSGINKDGILEESEEMKEKRRKLRMKSDWPNKKPEKYDYQMYGLVAISMDDKYGYVDSTETIVIPCIYDGAASFQNGLGAVSLGGIGTVRKHGFINKKGEVVIPIIYNQTLPISEELIGAKLIDLWGFLNLEGDLVIPFQFDEVSVLGFHKGHMTVQKNKKYGVIDKTGTMIIPLNKRELGRCMDGMVAFKEKGKWGAMDLTGAEVIKPIYDDRFSFYNNIATVKLNGESFQIDRTGNRIKK